MSHRAICGGLTALLLVCLAGWFRWSGRLLAFRLSPALSGILRPFESRETFASSRTPQLPSVYLWAWERPEGTTLSGSQPARAIVAATAADASSARTRA